MVSFKTLKLCTGLGCKVGKVKPPRINFGAVSNPIEHATPHFNVGTPTRVEQATREMTGATQLAEQNRTFVIGNKRVITRQSALCDTKYPRLTSDINSLEPMQNVQAFCNDFKTRTKELGLQLELHIPDNWNLQGMTTITDWIETGIKNGKFPTDIKHVVMSHGQGLSTNGTWVFSHSGQSVPEWIATNIKPGEKCLVAVCETGSTSLNKARPGIGNRVTNSFTNPSEPGKIMQSGNNNIIGHYLINEGATYYRPTIKFGASVKPSHWTVEEIPYTRQGANVTLTYREGAETLPFDPNLLKNIKGYTDSNGNVLPYILLDSLEVQNRGNGLGKVVMEDIKQIAKDRCGGRLILQPGNEYRNPSPFYYKCGLRSTTKDGADEILAYLNNGTPFKSGSSAPMYLPIE